MGQRLCSGNFKTLAATTSKILTPSRPAVIETWHGADGPGGQNHLGCKHGNPGDIYARGDVPPIRYEALLECL
jgi:hypothetical protein